jgi:hypothetical protein
MDTNTKIAGDLTIADWLRLKKSLESDPGNDTLWEYAYRFFEDRVSTRYLKPIEAIENSSGIEGEGFAISAILCSLIEALETFRQGKVYKRATKGNPLNEEKEYFKSQPVFETFLKNREPFKTHFTANDLAGNFYENVRCALLHEAATRNNWKIRIDTNTLVESRDGSVILNRDLFVEAIKQYMRNYKVELIKDRELRKAYIRKLDSICETA